MLQIKANSEMDAYMLEPETVSAGEQFYRHFEADREAAIELINEKQAGRFLLPYADWFFADKQFERALFYYNLVISTHWDTGVDSLNQALRRRVRYRLAIIEENQDENEGQLLEMFADAIGFNRHEDWEQRRRRLEHIRQYYPHSKIADDVVFALCERLEYTVGLEGLADYWEEFLRMYPDSPLCERVQKRLTHTYHNLGVESSRAGDYEKAQRWYRVFLQQPVMHAYKYHYTYFGVGEFFEERGKLEQAEQAYKMGVYSWGLPAYPGLGMFYERHYGVGKYIEFLKEEGKDELQIQRYLKDLGCEKHSRIFDRFIQSKGKWYEKSGSQELMLSDGTVLFMDLYKKNKSIAGDTETAEYVLQIRGAGEELLLKMDSVLFESEFRSDGGLKIANIADVNEPVLCVSNPSGGNAWNGNPWYLVSLDPDSFLKCPGRAARVMDIDSDGKDDLIWYDDTFENGLEWFCHTSAPGAVIFYRVEEGRVVPDSRRNAEYRREQIRDFDERIHKLRSSIVKDGNVQVGKPKESRLLGIILMKFLRYRLLGKQDRAWYELGRDLRFRDDDYFFFRRYIKNIDKEVIRKYPVSEIEELVREKLQKYSFNKDSHRSVLSYTDYKGCH